MFRRAVVRRRPTNRLNSARLFKGPKLWVHSLERRDVPATITVSGIGDELAVDGQVTLREAVASIIAGSNVNADVVAVGTYGTSDAINFSALFNSPQTISTGGEFLLSKSVAITGPGSSLLTIQNVAAASATSRLFNATAGTISLSGMKLTGGNPTTGGGGIRLASPVTLTDMDIASNSSSLDGGGVFVGGGSLTVNNSKITGNVTGATAQGGGIYVSGAQTVTMTNTTVADNQSGEDGGGIYFFSGGALNMTGSTVSGNKSNIFSGGAGGGGIYLWNASATIRNSTISGNSSDQGGFTANGGGLMTANGGTILVQNSTFAFNSAVTGTGGGFRRSGTASVTFDSSIFSNNLDSGSAPDVSGTIAKSTQSLFSNSLGFTVTTSTGDQLDVDPLLDPLANKGGLTQVHALQAGSPALNKGYNPFGLSFDQRGTGFPRTQGASTDVGSFEAEDPAPSATGTSPNVVTSGGLTQSISVTFSDLIGSKLIDFTTVKTGNLRVDGPGGFTATPTLKAPAPGADAPSIAVTFEFTPPVNGAAGWDFTDNGDYTITTTAVVADQVRDKDVPTPFNLSSVVLTTFSVGIPTVYTVNDLGDLGAGSGYTGDLRYVLGAANAEPGPASIIFDPAVFTGTQTISLFSGSLPDITDQVSITGPAGKVVLDGGGVYAILKINTPGTATPIGISNVIFNGGLGGGTTVASAITVTDEALSLDNVVVQNGTAGPAVVVTAAGGSVTATKSVFDNNSSTSSGGALRLDPNTSAVSITLTDSILTNNTSSGNGGAIYTNWSGVVTISRSTFSGNTASGAGGAITLWTASATITNSTFFGNTAVGAAGGGAISLQSGGSLTLNNTTITGNIAPTGAGIRASAAQPLAMTSTIIAGNTGANDVNWTTAVVTTGLGYNFTGTSANVTYGGTNNLTGANPQLGPLANNGGFTPTILPLAGSPVLETGIDSALTGGLDQRGAGFPRILMGNTQPNIGAVEGFLTIPSALLNPLGPIVTAGATPNTVSVTYSDDQGINAGGFGLGNIKIFAPDMVTELTITKATPDGGPPNSSPRTVTYEFAVPVNGAAGWDGTDNGKYTVVMQGSQVFDVDFMPGNSVPAGTLGTFDVAIPITYTVNDDQDLGSGVGLAGDLRYVLGLANTDGAPSSIVFDPTYFAGGKTISLLSDLPVISADVTITGPGANKATVSGGNTFRVFDITDGTTVKLNVAISGLTIADGSATTGLGAAVRVTGENLTLDGVHITKSTNTGGGGGGLGSVGPVTLNILNSTISGNSSSGDGGGVYQSGYGNTVLIQNSTISGNLANGLGGGFVGFAWGGTMTIQNSTLTQNSSGSGGGGIRITSGTINVESSIIAQNTHTGSPDVLATTVSAKTSLIGAAGAGHTFVDAGGGNVTGTLATPAQAMLLGLALNSGPMPTHLPELGSPVLETGSNPAGLANDQRGAGFPRILMGNTNPNMGAIEGFSAAPTAVAAPLGPIVTAGATPNTVNVTYSDNLGINAGGFGTGNIKIFAPDMVTELTITKATPDGGLPNTSPRTVTYEFAVPVNGMAGWDQSDNGTYTVVMQANQVFDIDFMPGNPVPNTQIGSFKVAIPTIYTVTATTDAGVGAGTLGDLRYCIDQANLDGGPSVINFALAGSNTITIGSDLELTAEVTINGPGAKLLTIDATGSADRVLTIQDTSTTTPGVFTIKGMTLTGGTTALDGGGVFIDGEEAVLEDVVVTGNAAIDDFINYYYGVGGGIALTGTGGKLTANNSTISGNNSTNTGGGINVSGSQQVILNNTTVSGNTADEDGGGIYFFSGGSLAMTGSTVSGNQSNALFGGAGGGGVYLWGTTATIVNSTIAQNSSNNSNGGGIVMQSGANVTIKNSTVAYNNAGTGLGGNIRVGGGTLTVTSTIVSDGLAGTGPDISGSVTANFSLIGNTAGATITGANNQTDVASGLDTTLALNGAPAGSPLTLALLTGSVAINNGSNPDGLTTDQRGAGFARVSGGTADIGAYEVQSAALPSKVSGNVIINNGDAQRSRVTSLKVNFDNPISFNDISKAFILTRDTGGNPSVGLNTVLDGSGLFVTITFTGGEVDAPPGNQTVRSLVDGKYTFTIVASEVANGFDGGSGVGTNFVLGSTSYVGGVTPTPATGIFRNFGDATGDGFVGADDFLAFRLAFLTANDTFDYDGVNNVDATVDFLQFRLNFLTSV